MHLKNTPSKTVRGIKWYPLPDVLATLGRTKGKYAGAYRKLAELAQDDGHFFVGGDEAIPATEALEKFISNYVDGGAERLSQVRRSFFYALGKAMRSSAMMTDAERLRILVIRDPGALRYILTADASALETGSSFTEWARRFAMIHSSSPLTSEYLGAEDGEYV
ncbi:hypothetical protein [Pararhodobacter sp.]|uniref:hypothetical protein n=1 Tax=Pararhodobacter sp. TaxID=2127056 RepID=UPI002FDE46FA